MAQLNPEEQNHYEWGQEIKHFIESDAYTYFVEQLNAELGKAFPRPDEPGWEEKYRHAWALAEVAQKYHRILGSLAEQSDSLLKKSRTEEPDFNEA